MLFSRLLTAAAEGGETAEKTFDLVQHLNEQQGTMMFVITCIVGLGFLGVLGVWIYRNAKRNKKRK